MSGEEEARLLAEHGATYVAYEWADRWLRLWRERHPDEDRDDVDILMSGDYPHGLDIEVGEDA